MPWTDIEQAPRARAWFMSAKWSLKFSTWYHSIATKYMLYLLFKGQFPLKIALTSFL